MEFSSVPKSAMSLSEAASSDCEEALRRGALVPMYSSTDDAGFVGVIAEWRRMSSPQKTAREVGTELTAPAMVPSAQQSDLIGEFCFQRIGAGALSQALISAGIGLSNQGR